MTPGSVEDVVVDAGLESEAGALVPAVSRESIDVPASIGPMTAAKPVKLTVTETVAAGEAVPRL